MYKYITNKRIKTKNKLILLLDLLGKYFLDSKRPPGLGKVKGIEATEVGPGNVHLGLPHEDAHHVLQTPFYGQVERCLA